jgi:hypothetical protein
LAVIAWNNCADLLRRKTLCVDERPSLALISGETDQIANYVGHAIAVVHCPHVWYERVDATAVIE